MEILVNFQALMEANSQLESIKKDFLSEIDNLKNIITGTPTDWRGDDANKFIEETNKKITDVSNEYNEYLTFINNEIERNLQKFQDVQRRNLSMME